jgi:hypothetical protein
MLKINTQEELLSLLKVISSEAVAVTKMMKESADPTVSSYLKQYEKDESVFGSLSEQEDEQEDEQDEGPPPGAETTPDEDEQAETESEPEPEEDQAVDAGVSFDSITRAINNLRSGKSLKNADVKKQASDYYDKLSDSERKALLVFLDSLSEIISGTLQGKDAQDPSEPPVSISFKSDQSSEDQPTEPEEENEESSEAQSDEEPPPESEEEDTTPPIRVNESQDMEALRKKVRRMMLRG